MVFFCKDCLPTNKQQQPPLFDPLGSLFPQLSRHESLLKQSALPPTYQVVRRSDCRLLRACWDQNWHVVQDRCQRRPEETYRKSQAQRTALHLATMPGVRCPATVLLLLIKANPHALIVPDCDHFGGTPLHFCCNSPHRHDLRLMKTLIARATEMHERYHGARFWRAPYQPRTTTAAAAASAASLKFKQERQHRRGNSSRYRVRGRFTGALPPLASPPQGVGGDQYDDDTPLHHVPLMSRDDPLVTNNVCWSPLYLATRKPSPSRLLILLLDAHVAWMAPWTGGETVTQVALLSYDVMGYSPLRTLWTPVLDSSIIPDSHTDLAPPHPRRTCLVNGAACRAMAHKIWTESHQYHLREMVVPVHDYDVWTQSMILLQPHCRDLRLLVHHVCQLYQAVPELLHRCAQVWPDAMLRPDNNGRLPLHVLLQQLERNLPGHAPSTPRKINAGIPPSSVRGRNTIAASVHQYKLWQWQVDVIAQAQPQALLVPDPRHHLVPALLAACWQAPVDTIFRLVRACPQVVL